MEPVLPSLIALPHFTPNESSLPDVNGRTGHDKQPLVNYTFGLFSHRVHGVCRCLEWV